MGVSNPASIHCSDEHLLFYADGELSAWLRWRVKQHVSQCEHCRNRMAVLQSMFAGLRYDQIETDNRSTDPGGPRALLKARMAEFDQHLSKHVVPHRVFVRVVAYATVLATLGSAAIGLYRHHARTISAFAQPLPDPAYTPGSTRSVALEQLCTASSDVTQGVPADLQKKVFQEYGIKNTPVAEFEVDYLITPALGGSEDVRNLWPEPHGNTEWNSYVKDQLEDRLHHMVCEHQIDLSEAQRAIASNWIVAYKKYFHTERPLHPDELRTENDSPALPSRVTSQILLMRVP